MEGTMKRNFLLYSLTEGRTTSRFALQQEYIAYWFRNMWCYELFWYRIRFGDAYHDRLSIGLAIITFSKMVASIGIVWRKKTFSTCFPRMMKKSALFMRKNRHLTCHKRGDLLRDHCFSLHELNKNLNVKTVNSRSPMTMEITSKDPCTVSINEVKVGEVSVVSNQDRSSVRNRGHCNYHRRRLWRLVEEIFLRMYKHTNQVTPADCVKLPSITFLKDRTPGSCVVRRDQSWFPIRRSLCFYSGTDVSRLLKGQFEGYPSIWF